MGQDDVVIIGDISSLGINEVDISNQLDWFILNSRKLVICNYVSTYEFGVVQPMNKAVLATILQSILNSHKNIIEIPRNKRSNAGRSKIAFPEKWDELYELWSDKKITSKEFLEKSGLKKATFYNLLTEYKEIQKLNKDYIERYKQG